MPEQRPIEHAGRYALGTPAALPAVGCLAHLHSLTPARDFGRDCSLLTVLWFQDDYAFPLSEAAEHALLRIDWDTRASDEYY